MTEIAQKGWQYPQSLDSYWNKCEDCGLVRADMGSVWCGMCEEYVVETYDCKCYDCGFDLKKCNCMCSRNMECGQCGLINPKIGYWCFACDKKTEINADDECTECGTWLQNICECRETSIKKCTECGTWLQNICDCRKPNMKR